MNALIIRISPTWLLSLLFLSLHLAAPTSASAPQTPPEVYVFNKPFTGNSLLRSGILYLELAPLAAALKLQMASEGGTMRIALPGGSGADLTGAASRTPSVVLGGKPFQDLLVAKDGTVFVNSKTFAEQAGFLYAANNATGIVDISSPRTAGAQVRSGWSGPTAGTLPSFDFLKNGLTPEGMRQLKTILVPQNTPEEAYRLELEMMKQGFYYSDLDLFDARWRRQNVSPVRSPSQKYRDTANRFDQPFETYIDGGYAILYYPNHRNLGPVFCERTPSGWILNRTDVLLYIHYSPDYTSWMAYDGPYPHLPLLQKVFRMKVGTAGRGQTVYTINQ